MTRAVRVLAAAGLALETEIGFAILQAGLVLGVVLCMALAYAGQGGA